MAQTATKAPWAPNTRIALAVSAAAIADMLVPAALALTCARVFRHRHVTSDETPRRRSAHR